MTARKKRQQAIAKGTARMVVCWKCKDGILVREQGTSSDSGAIAVCTVAKVLMRDPRKPPKSCPVRRAWEEDDAEGA